MPPYRGGISEFSSRLAAQLFETGCTVRGYSFSRLYPGPLFPGRTQYQAGSKPPVPVRRCIDSLWPGSWLRTSRSIRSFDPDFAVVAWWHPFFAPSLLGSLPRGLTAAFICHNVLPHDRFPMSGILSRRMLGRADLAVVHSSGDAETARRLRPQARVLQLFHPLYDQYLDGAPAGRSEARRSLGLPESGRLILFFGLVRPYKGLQDLIEATASLEGDTHLLVVGEPYGDPEPHRRALSRPELSGRARWIDRFVPDDEVGAYFRAADVVALPYREATQSGVGQIALAFRKVLAVTDAGGLPELVEPGVTGAVARPGDPDSLAAALRRSLELSEGSGTGEAVAGKAAEFGWDSYVSRLLEALQ
jgi:glycosyltransferase involved in cell wall biosynthesis